MAKDCAIYISSHNIQVIWGSNEADDMIKIEDYETFELKEGAMINGVIIDEQEVRNGLRKVAEKGVHEAQLLIDSGQILLKNVDVPILPKKELIQICKDELSDLDASSLDLIYDYTILRDSYEDKKGGEILCCGVERKLVSSYLEVFENANIKLRAINISVNALHKLTQERMDLKDQTYVIVVVDGTNVSTYLFEHNHYTFSNRARLFANRNSSSFVSEMSSNISQIIQFSKSKQSPYKIRAAYFCGLLEEEEEPVINSVKEGLSIDAKMFPNAKIILVNEKDKEKKFALHEYVFPVGCLIRK